MRKKFNSYIKLGSFVLLALITASCQKVIHVDLNNSNPTLVVEGGLTDTINGSVVRITKTTDFYSPSIPQSVSGAIVQLTDSMGNSYNYTETFITYQGMNTQVYVSKDVHPKHNVTYSLKVLVDGNIYTGESRLLTPIPIDSIKFLKSDRPRKVGTASIVPHCYFKDPKGIANYYRLRIKILNDSLNTNNNKEDRYYLRDDKFFDGNENDFSFDGIDLVVGDRIQVELISLDKKTYEYFRTLANIVSSGGGMSSSSPANPNSNISNNALGYFAAEAISVKVVTVP